ncbi:MAG: DNA repair protein RecO [Gammaproteobacteria bacterium]|nr:DNA repair protein RecO [Gammaproteobacteria bacterium]MCY4276445.1 DNA repair protein RecO [Gammaproteobacteria bacterium]MCY4322760.1 DNA repair protein RecO [Gammaproteobacteria bacterium]
MNVERVRSEAAYVLHAWPYRETSSILDVLSETHGRVRVIARGAKRAKGGQALRPFNRLALSWSGREELKSLQQHELLRHRWLQGDALLSGLYANEITLRALRRYKAEEFLFDAYERMLDEVLAARAAAEQAVPLRRYELALLSAIGYGLNLAVDCEGADLSSRRSYQFDASLGLVPADTGRQAFSGESLLAIAACCFEDVEVRRAAKLLTRTAIAPHIGPAPLMSRGLHE